MTITFVINFLCYALVPAVGPRYFMVGQFASANLHGMVATPFLESLMRLPPFNRDSSPRATPRGRWWC